LITGCIVRGGHLTEVLTESSRMVSSLGIGEWERLVVKLGKGEAVDL